MASRHKILERCPGCGRRGIREAAKGRCARCYSRLRRASQTPEQREVENESSRRWKHNHPGYHRNPQPREEQWLPIADHSILCWSCGIDMVLPDATGLCGFCKVELPILERIMAYEFPGTDQGWTTYFDLLSNDEVLELKSRLDSEMINRTGKAIEKLLPNLTRLYRTDGKPPAHHQSPQLRLWGSPEEI